MGSSADESNDNGGIDPSVGGLVWVRRRNGSWWPGRIVALDEISESCLASPKSGTPVKLLGRDDASVDWYNLEKSKRVKAFRCGEYDQCIEKAKASAANPNRKAVKYARREDAIIHALELESALQGRDHQYVYSKMNNLVGEQSSPAQVSPTISHSGEDDELINEESDSEDDSGSAQELSQSGISFEEPTHNGASKVQSGQGKRRKPSNDSEDDGTEAIKRMKGIEDLGMCVGSKRKLSGGGAVELVQHDCSPLYDSHTGNGMSNGSPVNGSKGYNSSLKGKRSQVANVHELKRKYRRRPLTKVLESTAMVSIPVACEELPSSNGSSLCELSDAKVSGMESNESRKGISMVVNNNSDSTGVSCETSLHVSENVCDASLTNNKTKENDISSISVLATEDTHDKLFDDPFVGEEKHSADLCPVDGALARQSSLSSQAEVVSLKNEGLNESGLTSLTAVLVDDLCRSWEKGTTWLLTGKRNMRKLSKNSIQDSGRYVGVDDVSNAYLAGTERLDGLQLGAVQKVDCDGTGGSETLNNCRLSEPFFEDVFWGWNRSSHQQPPMRGSRVETKVLHHGPVNPQRSLPFRQSSFTAHPKYQMSEHPVKSFCSDSQLYDVELEVKANHRPQNVSLVSLVSKIDGKAIVGHPLTVEVLDDGFCDRMMSDIKYDATHLAPSTVKKASYAVKRKFEVGRKSAKDMSQKPRSSRSKSSKVKKGGLMSKKIRKLSSLTGQRSEEERKPTFAKIKDPVITCIPLKLVFSRINEAINGLARPTHRALTLGNS
ncbi:hypothetical protein HS088_TW22G01556 [Tripterygium wilfordii]|uniref:PWWP domain-containing protein n=1 Tax=Tripterygium wilfordii TaxID=458696 RepID=A0A7J7C123_TRIWF|nr:hypothetical protein HS088_TW22G01556 [Tripterygium wilfordii]